MRPRQQKNPYYNVTAQQDRTVIIRINFDTLFGIEDMCIKRGKRRKEFLLFLQGI